MNNNRIVMRTKDNVLVMNRAISSKYQSLYLTDEKFRDIAFKDDASQKGVKVVSYEYDNNSKQFNVLVEWL